MCVLKKNVLMEVTMENHGSHLNTITPISYLMVAPNIDLSLFNRSSKGSFVHNIVLKRQQSELIVIAADFFILQVP